MVSTRELIHVPRKQFAPNLEWSLIAGLLGPNMPFYNAKDGKDAVSWMLSQFSSCSTIASRCVGTTHQNLMPHTVILDVKEGSARTENKAQ